MSQNCSTTHWRTLTTLFKKCIKPRAQSFILVFSWNQFHEKKFREYDFTEILISRQDINKRFLYFKSSWWCLWNWNISLNEFIKCSIKVPELSFISWKRSALKGNVIDWAPNPVRQAHIWLILKLKTNKMIQGGRN